MPNPLLPFIWSEISLLLLIFLPQMDQYPLPGNIFQHTLRKSLWKKWKEDMQGNLIILKNALRTVFLNRAGYLFKSELCRDIKAQFLIDDNLEYVQMYAMNQDSRSQLSTIISHNTNP